MYLSDCYLLVVVVTLIFYMIVEVVDRFSIRYIELKKLKNSKKH